MTEVTKELTITRIFDAPRELVFKAWTNPELVAKWWGPLGVTNPECYIDAKVGGKLRIVMLAGPELGQMAGQRWPMNGEFKELTEPQKLVFANQAVDDEGNVLIEALTNVELEEVDGKTKMTLHVTAKGVSPQAPQMLEGMNQGWTQSIDKLEKLLAQ